MLSRSAIARVSPWFPAAQYIRLYIHAYILWGGDRCEDIVLSVVCMYICLVCAAAGDITRSPAISSCYQFTRNDGKSPIGDVAEIRRLTSAKSPPGRACARERARARWLARDERTIPHWYIYRVCYLARVSFHGVPFVSCSTIGFRSACGLWLWPSSSRQGSHRRYRYCHHHRRRRRRRAWKVIAMPLLRKQPFQRLYVSSDFRDDDEVYHCEVTNEIFKNYKWVKFARWTD